MFGDKETLGLLENNSSISSETKVIIEKGFAKFVLIF
jgi:hypothetical protein